MSTKLRKGWVTVHLATNSTFMLCWGMISIEAEGSEKHATIPLNNADIQPFPFRQHTSRWIHHSSHRHYHHSNCSTKILFVQNDLVKNSFQIFTGRLAAACAGPISIVIPAFPEDLKITDVSAQFASFDT